MPGTHGCGQVVNGWGRPRSPAPATRRPAVAATRSRPASVWTSSRRRTHDRTDSASALRAAGLDEGRLALYTLAQRLSLTAGPLRLLDGDFPDRAFMAGIAEYNLNKVLEAARS